MVVLLTTASLEGQHLAKSFFNTGLLGAAGTDTDTGPSDDQFNRVSFLSHFDGANNGVNNAFDDGSASNHTITANGNVTQGSFGPFARPDGEWGVSFDGSGDILKTPSLTIGTGTITYECWLNFSTVAGNATIVSFNDDNSSRVSVYNSDGDLKIYSSANGGRTVKSSAFTTPNSWIKLLLVRASNTATVYLDGTSVGTGTMPENLTGVLAIGAYAGSEVFNGIISNVRLSDNARQSGNYTVETAPLASDSNTDLLTCQSNRFVDNSSNGHTITPSGNPAVTAFGPFLTSKVYSAGTNGASAFIAARADGINIADSSEFNMTGEFSVEFWVYLISNDAGGIDIMFRGYGNGQNTQIGYEPSNRHLYLYNDANPVTSSTDMHINSWNHVVCCRTSSTTSIFLNGVRVGTASYSTAVDWGGGTTQFMAYGTGEYSPAGYGTDLRLLKGSSAYDATASTLTVPTAPLTAVTNTKLLLNMADGQAIDSAAQNNLTLYGTAKTSTAQYKFGTASLLLDGNSDYASFPENGGNDIDNAGNWTVEFFWRFNDKTSPQYQMILTKYNLQIYTDNGELRLAVGNGSGYFINNTGGTVLDNDTWYHIAVVKNGTSYNEYLNGTNEANLDGTSSSIIDSGGRPWYIGTLQTAEGTYPANGYIDEVRISKFARYTSNFTAPTEPFADKGQ